MNEETHWDKLASRYEDEIFDVFHSDKNKILPRYFRKHGNRKHTAIDFGCGVGKAFEYLSPLFKEIIGTDISASCLSMAAKRSYSNIKFKKADLTRPGLKFPPADFAFCCNVVMLSQPKQNHNMLKNIQRALKPNGSAVIVMPALESILYSTFRLMEWYSKEGVVPEAIPKTELSYYKGGKLDLLKGLMQINGVPTKHYLETELRVLFKNAGLIVTAIEKIEYDWKTEFADPPSWMGAPYPWDWLVECKNK